MHADLSKPLDKEFGPSNGTDLQRQPELWEQAPESKEVPAVEAALTDDDEAVGDSHIMDTVVRAHAMNNGETHHGPSHDLLPEF